MTTRKISLTITTALTSVLLASSLAHAQGNDEIIVTATKRQQSLQSTPVAVTVTSADTIEKTQILDIADLQSVVPSLRVTQLQSSVNTNFIIRGFGNGANNAGIEPSVGVFIDGVYRSRSAAQIGDLPKLQRVEVLRGPQSTLFGKNASAGVISITTAKPAYDTHGYIEAGIGNYGLNIFRGYVTGPIDEKVAVSLGGSLNSRDGYTSNVLGLESVNNRDRWNLRGQILVEPTDNVSVRVIADISEIDETCCTVTNFVNGPTAGAIMFLGGTLSDPADPFSYVAHQNTNSINRVTDKGVSVQADIDFNNFVLTSISSFRNNDSFGESDTDYTTLRILDSTGGGAEINSYTQELRLTSTGDNMVDWMVGGYVFKEDINQISFVDVGDDFRNYLDLLAGGPSVLAGVEGLFGFAPGSFFPGTVRTLDTFTQDNTAYSAFATVDFHATDRLTVTGGLNYTKDKKTVNGNSVIPEVFSNIDLENDITVFNVPGRFILTPAQITGLQALQFLPQFLAFPNSVEDGRTDEDKLTWTARLTYEANDNLNVYASAATGFKATSWNLSRDSRPFASDLAALTTAGLTLPNQTTGTRLAGPENAMVFELGAKAKFSRGALNVAIFDQEIDDFQSNTFLGTGFVLSNAGKSSVKGIELDATVTPIDPLTLTFAATLLDAKFDSFPNSLGPGGTIVDRSGEKIDGIPEVSIATSATYNFELSDNLSGFLRGDYQYESETNVAADIFSIRPTRTINIVNASAGLKTESGFGVQFWARNLFNDEYILAIFPGVVQAGTLNGYPNAPRTYGVSLRKEF